jgi:hypothetical protein
MQVSVAGALTSRPFELEAHERASSCATSAR